MATSGDDAGAASEPVAPAGRTRAGTAAFLVLALLLSVLTGAAVGAPAYLPTNDGPEHVFASHAAQRLDDASLGYGKHLKLGAAFSQVGFDRLLALGELVLPWRLALRACLVFMVLLWAWGVVALAAATGGRRRVWLGLFGFAAAVQWLLYMGLFPFYLSNACGLYVLALAFWKVEWDGKWRLVLAAGLLLQAFVHPVPALCSMLVLAGIGLVRSWRRDLGREAVRFGLTVLPAVVVVAASVGPTHSDPGVWLMPAADRAVLAMRAFVSGPPWRWAPLPAAALAGAGLALAHKPWRDDKRQGALLLTGLLFALLATQTPYHIPGWNFFHMRFSPLAAILLVLLLPVERWSRPVRLLGLALLVAYATASNAWALGYNLRLYHASADLLSGLDAPLHRSGVRLPLILEPRAGEPQPFLAREVPGCLANWNAGALFAVAQGGVPAYGFAEAETIHPLVWRWPVGQGLRPPRPTRGFEHALSEPEVLGLPGGRKAAVTRLLSFAPYYEDVIFYGRPEEVAWLHERRFDIDYEKGGLAIARFHACPVTLVVEPGPSGHPAAWVELGWTPARQAVQSMKLPAMLGALSPREIPLTSPCGDVWLRVFFDDNGDGAMSAGDTACVESDESGGFGLHVEPEGSRAHCHPGRPIDIAAGRSK